VPLKLAGIEVMFATPYEIAEPGETSVSQTLTAIICTNIDEEVTAYFANVLESLLPFMGDNPSTRQVEEAVRQLIDLFQKLRNPARRSIVGLLGELLVIKAARDTVAAVSAWRSDPNNRFDFALGKMRLDVKASSNRQRVHDISFEQANPPMKAVGLIASIWIEAQGGGESLSELLTSIEARLQGKPNEIARLRTVVADTLGGSLPQAMGWRFDSDVAQSSLRYFEATVVPAIRPPLPKGVSSARFISDLSGCPPIELALFAQRLDPAELGMLPQN
jgi:hypothetical protein